MSGDEGFISRWSRRKREARSGEEAKGTQQESVAAARDGPSPLEALAPRVAADPVPVPAPEPLPPLESLTPESDFSPFMREGVDPDLRRSAVKKLFADPRFNVMDRLDVYIDDYSKPDPLPEGWLEKMNQVARLGIFVPPKDGENVEKAMAEGTAEGTASPSPASNPQGISPPDAAVTPAEPIDAPPVGESPFREG